MKYTLINYFLCQSISLYSPENKELLSIINLKCPSVKIEYCYEKAFLDVIKKRKFNCDEICRNIKVPLHNVDILNQIFNLMLVEW